jgi:hypothetical protein
LNGGNRIQGYHAPRKRDAKHKPRERSDRHDGHYCEEVDCGGLSDYPPQTSSDIIKDNWKPLEIICSLVKDLIVAFADKTATDRNEW